MPARSTGAPRLVRAIPPGDAAARLARLRALETIDRDWAFGGAHRRGVTRGDRRQRRRGRPSVGARPARWRAWRWSWRTGSRTVVADDAGDLFGHGTACARHHRRAGARGGARLHPGPGLGPQGQGRGLRAPRSSGRSSGGCGSRTSSLSSKSDALFPVFHDDRRRRLLPRRHPRQRREQRPRHQLPIALRSVISVAAHAEPDPWRFYYNPTPPVEFGAWGVDVPVAWKDGGKIVATGNSFAAPHVAGLVALLVEQAPRPDARSRSRPSSPPSPTTRATRSTLDRLEWRVECSTSSAARSRTSATPSSAQPDGALYAEELFGVEGFTGRSSLLYHLTPPTQTHQIESATCRSSSRTRPTTAASPPPGEHRRTSQPRGDGVSGRVPLFFNSDVDMGVVRPAERDAGELLPQRRGATRCSSSTRAAGRLETVFGPLATAPATTS